MVAATLATGVSTAPAASAAEGDVTTVAGGAAASVSPSSVTVDANGNLYVTNEVLSVVQRVDATTGLATAIAGNLSPGYTGDGGPANDSQVWNPDGITLDAGGNVYFGDKGGSAIRKIDTNGIITTIAGGNGPGSTGDGGPALDARVGSPQSVVVDSNGNVFFAETTSHRVRRIDAVTQIITTVAGDGTAAFSGDGGPAVDAQLHTPSGIAIDSADNLYIADRTNNRIRRIDAISGDITTIAGNGTPGFSGDGGLASGSQVRLPEAITVDSDDNIYVVDTANVRVRKIDATTGIIDTVAGNGGFGFGGDNGPAVDAQFASPQYAVVDTAGNLYIADRGNQRVRKVDTAGIITTAAGNGTFTFGGDTGPATNAQLRLPSGVVVDDSGTIFIADHLNHRIRKVDPTGIITTIAGRFGVGVLANLGGFSGDGGPAVDAQLSSPYGLALDSTGTLFIADENNNRIRKIDGSGIITTVVGDGTSGFGGDNGPATAAQIRRPSAIAFDASDNLYIADTDNHRIRRVDQATGIITTIAGDGVAGFAGDGGPATAAQMRFPRGVAIGPDDTIYLSDSNSNRIRTIDGAGIITTILGNGAPVHSGDGGLAVDGAVNQPRGLVVDATGNLYLSDHFSYRVRRIDAITGVITTIVGDGNPGFSGDNGPAADARVSGVEQLAFGPMGDLYFADSANDRIRRVQLSSAPVGVNDEATTTEVTPVTIAVLSNDTDVDTPTASLLIVAGSVTDPSNGVAAVVSGGIEYTPNPGFSGTDTFAYRPSDGANSGSQAVVTVTVTATPVGVDDEAAVVEDGVVIIDVTANDTDADTAAADLTIAGGSISDPANGSAEIVAGGIEYTPTADFNGSDTFTYQASDGSAVSESTTVTVTITAVNDKPVGTADAVTPAFDTAVTVNVIDGSGGGADTDVDGDSLTVTAAGGVSNGTATFTGQEITYTPNAGFIGSDEVTYIAADPSGLTATATLTVTVEAPTVAALCNGKPVTIDLTLSPGATATAGDDVILGTSANDVIDGLDGNDTICGQGGDDTIFGGDGDDVLFGDDGKDFLFGGDGDDTLIGGEGNDRARGNQGTDIIDGQNGNDFLYGGTGNDTITGGDGNDTIGGFGGADTIDSGPGNDKIFGGFGADLINAGPGNDVVNGLIGNDIINGGDGDDILNGDQGQDTIHGDNGNDEIFGGNSLDTLFGDAGDDSVNGGKADDALSGGDGNDTCTGNRDIDTADDTCEQIFGVP
jgi:hypothetical protein